VTEKGRPSGCWTSRFKRVGGESRKIRFPIETLRRDDESFKLTKWLIPCFQEKPLSFRLFETVPKTDSGGRAEYAKVIEITLVKELGKMTP